MNIYKIGHCCLVIKTDGKTIVTDPGNFTTEQDELTGVDIILVTHEHGDHFHMDSVKKMKANNPEAVIVTNPTVGKLLEAEGIACDLVSDGLRSDVHGVSLEGIGTEHAIIYDDLGKTENTGYMIAGKLWYPGDSFTDPQRPVDILALPIAGPWMKLAEAFDYARKLKPRVAFPVHDAIMRSPQMINRMAPMILANHGVTFQTLDAGETKDF